jgi:hypothetical protein
VCHCDHGSASNPTPAAPAEGVIDLFHPHLLLHIPKHHYYLSIKKRMLAITARNNSEFH